MHVHRPRARGTGARSDGQGRARSHAQKKITKFILFINPCSSIFDYTTYAMMWFAFKGLTPAHATRLQTGWFVQSLWTQTLIIRVMRTLTSLGIMAVGISLPFSPFAGALEFASLPLLHWPLLLPTLFLCVVLTQVVRTWLLKRAWMRPGQRARRAMRTSHAFAALMLTSLSAVPTWAADPRRSVPSPSAATVRGAGPLSSPLDSANWQVNFQSTYVWQHKPAFQAAYTGTNSLLTSPETGYTLTATLFLAYRPWKGAALVINPEAIQSQEISNLTGLGGLANGEEQRGGGPVPTVYPAQLFLRQTIDLGGSPSRVEAGPNQFAEVVTKRRLVSTLGWVSVTDVFDANSYSHDPRTSFLNWALWTYGASDFAADSRGYTLGLSVEYDHDDWAFRLGRFAQPKKSNGLPLDYNVIAHYGDVLEIEHDHTILGRIGAIRLDLFHNRARMGAFRDALDFAQRNGVTPAVANVRKNQSKFALGVGLEQAVTQDIGVFARFSFNDGRTETYAYAEIERSLTIGSTMSGRLWRRPNDTLGIAYALNGLSDTHRDYLSAGGLGFFIGDGKLTYGMENIVEAFYSFNVFSGLWFSLDGQHVVNPAYNVARGPVMFVGCRFHLEY